MCKDRTAVFGPIIGVSIGNPGKTLFAQSHYLKIGNIVYG